jgi:Cytochrome P450
MLCIPQYLHFTHAGKPIVGNLLDIPLHHSWFKFTAWADQYGPVFKLNIAGGAHIVVSTEKIANELMRERGTLSSSREQFQMAPQLLSDNLCPLFLLYRKLWRNGCKLMHHLTMSSVAISYQAIQKEESIRCASGTQPGRLRALVRAVYSRSDLVLGVWPNNTHRNRVLHPSHPRRCTYR